MSHCHGVGGWWAEMHQPIHFQPGALLWVGVGGLLCLCGAFLCKRGISSLYNLIQPCGADSLNRSCTLSDDTWGGHPPLPSHQGRRLANAAYRDQAMPQHPSCLPAFPSTCAPSFQLLFSFFPASVQRKKKGGSCNTRQKVPAVTGCAGRDGSVCSADLVLPLEREGAVGSGRWEGWEQPCHLC